MSLHPSYSMRKRILAGLAIALILIMGLAGTISYWVALHEADEIFSARLATSARVLDSLLTHQVEHATLSKPFIVSTPSALATTPPDNGNASGHPYETKLAFQVWHEENRLLVRSESAPEERLGPLQAGFWERQVAGHPWHVFTLKSGKIWIEVAEESSVRDEIASNIGAVLSSPLLVGSTLLLLLVNLIVIAGFSPLYKLAEAIEQRDPKNNTPVENEQTPTEIRPLILALNKLFQRVAHVLARERHFTDAAAHELRTPITALSLHAQNMASARNEEERAMSTAHLLTGLKRTKHLVEQMLTYRRIGNQSETEESSLIDINAEITYLVQEQRTVLEGSGLNIELLNLPHNVLIQAPKARLEIMLRNLLDNACKYANNSQQPITVCLQETPSHLVIQISNPSFPLPQAQLQRIFEPYYRAPSARCTGNGLGLAIVKEIVDNQAWPIQATQTQYRFTIEVHLSRTPPIPHS